MERRLLDAEAALHAAADTNPSVTAVIISLPMILIFVPQFVSIHPSARPRGIPIS
jgi:hypothetical protein